MHSTFSPPENTNVAGRALLLGGNILSRFDTSLQFYFDNYDRDVPQLDEFRDTFDLDFQNHIALGARQDLMSRGFSWDANAYFVDSLPVQPIPSYTRLDSQVRSRLGERIELNLVGQNLLQDHHEEFNDFLQAVNSLQVKRSAYVKMSWQF